jgi:hypothetical protein
LRTIRKRADRCRGWHARSRCVRIAYPLMMQRVSVHPDGVAPWRVNPRQVSLSRAFCIPDQPLIRHPEKTLAHPTPTRHKPHLVIFPLAVSTNLIALCRSVTPIASGEPEAKTPPVGKGQRDSFAQTLTESVGMRRGGEWGAFALSVQMIGRRLADNWHVLPAYYPPIVITPCCVYNVQRGNTTEDI